MFALATKLLLFSMTICNKESLIRCDPIVSETLRR